MILLVADVHKRFLISLLTFTSSHIVPKGGFDQFYKNTKLNGIKFGKNSKSFAKQVQILDFCANFAILWQKFCDVCYKRGFEGPNGG